MRTINPYEETDIISDDNPDEIIATLPRIYVRLNLIDDKPENRNVITDFSNKSEIKFRKDITEESKYKLMAAIASSQEIMKDPSIKEKEQARYVEIENQLFNRNPQPTEATPSENTTKEDSGIKVNWDFDDE